MGARIISIDKLLFASALTNIQTTVNNVKVTYSGWESKGENSTVLDSYVEGFQQLHDIMRAYQKLVTKDVAAMQSIDDSFKRMDSRLELIWKR